MSGFTTVLALIAMGLVVIVLIRGLFNMLKGQDANRSNKLMQLRLLLQAIAIVLIMLTLWLTGGGRWTGEAEQDLHPHRRQRRDGDGFRPPPPAARTSRRGLWDGRRNQFGHRHRAASYERARGNG